MNIRRMRPDAPRVLDADYSQARLLDRIGGAWLGRCCGCYLGKPVEGARRKELAALLRHQGMRSLGRYLAPSVPRKLLKSGKWWPRNVLTQTKLRCMPEDDDTNYTALGLAVVRAHGGAFSPFDVANFWLNNVPYLHTCTAERVAYRNLAAGIDPPQSARRWNPYREWIGAQIRADAFGYLAVGRPERAAGYAWRDACISHVKNGIYGEMWVAAMLAAAYVHDRDIRAVITAGLDEIPVRSRLASAVRGIVRMHDRGAPAADALESIHARWDENNPHHWCHTISNAEVVTYALLWGGLDFGRTICLAVEACFDTDCNGATAGSVAGMMLGARKLPARWAGRLQDRLLTGVSGYHDVRISRIARDTAELAASLLKEK
jgi:ADP-ribosylglycohydrolase